MILAEWMCCISLTSFVNSYSGSYIQNSKSKNWFVKNEQFFNIKIEKESGGIVGALWNDESGV